MKTVLVVDDEADAVEFVKAVLEDDETKLVSARDGELGLKAAREQRPDLVVLDVQMPKKDGFTVLAELKQDPATSSIPVVMLTAMGATSGVAFSKSDVGEFIGAEPDAYVEKPVDPATLKATVARLIGR
ncbi:MAG: hypothetical protein AMK73_07355 [Planctomycetes bacterium SM23_32]|nr:MAG: hypothetical protein AMK73_07355 [Planctomycetes bacterium SM23_32]